MKVSELEYKLLKSIPQARTASDAARIANVTPSYVLRRLRALRSRFAIRGVFDYRALGLEEHATLIAFDAKIWETVLPYVTCKVTVQTGMQPEKLLLLVLAPRGRAGDVADILGVPGNGLEDAVPFRLRLDTAPLTVLSGGSLSPLTERLCEVIDSGRAPRFEGMHVKKVDEIDLWLVAELSRDPFAKLSRAGQRMGLKQQVVSYHHVYHVRPLHLYNSTIPLLFSSTPGKLIQLKVREGLEEAAAWAMASLPFTYLSISLPGSGRVYALAYPGAWELDLLRRLSRCSGVEDYRVLGYAIEKPREYTLPFGEVLDRGDYRLDILYEAIYTPGRVDQAWKVYEL